MPKNYAQLSFTPTVKRLQEHYGSRKAYQRAEDAGDRYILGPNEMSFIASRDHFYLSSVGENGWPYIQHRGGPAGFLQVADATTLRFADYAGNRQFISAGNILATGKAFLFLIDYASRERLKLWTHATMQLAEEVPEIAASLADPDYPEKVERVFTLEIQAIDWNCPKHITPRFTLEQLKQSPALIQQLLT